jgi:predicted nucleotidyltransferase
MTLDELRASERDHILAIARRHGVTDVKVFGSFARGDARVDSDLDLLVEAGPKTSAFFPGGLLADLEDLLGRHVEVVEEQGLHHAIRDRILKGAVPL